MTSIAETKSENDSWQLTAKARNYRQFLASLVVGLHQLVRPRRDARALRRALAMCAALRCYFPSPLAAQLESGRRIESEERDVSVLFVDIRGFTAFSEDHSAAAVFATVSRYTRMVSEIVGRHGGCVAEFHGDGLMVVFGAPNPLPQKERAALEAGLAIVAAMKSIGSAVVTGDGAPLSAGVGIATGTAVVGNLHAADHVIWSVIGNSTNLAARLQALTRDWNAAIVIDAATWQAAREIANRFERRENVPIRGRRNTEDVYLLPLAPA